MRQTLLDQFFKKKNVQRRSYVAGERGKSKIKAASGTSVRKREDKAESNLPVPVQSIKLESTSDCMIIYERTMEGSGDFMSQIIQAQDTSVTLTQTYGEVKQENEVNFKREIVQIDDISPSKKPKLESSFSEEAVFNADTSPFSQVRYSPKVSTPRTARHNRSYRESTRLFRNWADELAELAIEQMNLAKQGAISERNFDLEKIYSRSTFEYKYTNVNTKTSKKYEFLDVTQPANEISAKFLFNAIVTVFSKPINCSYFDENDLDVVYSILTLSVGAQILLGRMLKRMRKWHRKSSIQYENIAENLKPLFEELQSKSLCTLDASQENIRTLLKLLQADEISQICKKLKRNSGGRKEKNISELLKYSRERSLISGAKSPYSNLIRLIFDKLEYCVRVTDKMWNIFDRIMTLLLPDLDPQMNIADASFMLLKVFREEITYPELPIKPFPLFSCGVHLQNYIKARRTLTDTLNCIDKKDWEKVKHFANLAKEEWQSIHAIEHHSLKNSSLPKHVRRFMPGYTWLKVLSNSVDAYKKESKDKAIEILNVLIGQRCHMQSRRGEWYAELALIEMCHKKNVDRSADIICKAFMEEDLTLVAKLDLLDRAERIARKKTGVNADVKSRIQSILEDVGERVKLKYRPPTNKINASLMKGNVAGSKSKWLIEEDMEAKSYGSVELVALSHYKSRQGFPCGLHCEGALPVLLFCTLFWEEIYDPDVPGAFVTEYQDSPLDLCFGEFYESRQEKINMKLQIAQTYDTETLSDLMESKFNSYNKYQSIMQTHLFQKSSDLREIVYCLGVDGVLGICKRLLDNFKLWRAGFPDLIVWNFSAQEYKIVEVKGPGDTLSTKQKLWLEYLCKLGLNVEVCMVEDSRNPKRRRRVASTD